MEKETLTDYMASLYARYRFKFAFALTGLAGTTTVYEILT